MQWPISDHLREYLTVSYTLDRVLGEGGMGCVILATERTLERRVAIKVLRAESATDQEFRERFRREARTAARLSHPNIVPLYTFGEVEGEMFFVMAYVDGETLATRLRRLGALDPIESRRLLAALAEALDYAHASGIVHRDIKPENILIDAASGRPMLTDFGIAREHSAATSLTQTGVIVGTPHYIAPEQAAGGRDIDGRADLYSLGVVAYRAFAGRLPFGGESVQDVLRQHMIAEPAPVPAERTEQDPGLADIITRALRKDPAERWATGRELADALRDADSDDGLPESLVGIESMFARVTYLGALGAAGLAFLPLIGALSPAEGMLSAAVLAAMAAIAPFLVAGVAKLKDGIPFRRVWTMGWRAPRNWRAWWPRRFRRPGDMWDRLPREVKLARAINAAVIFLLLPIEAGAIVWMLSSNGQNAFIEFTQRGPAAMSTVVAALVLVVVAIVGPISVATVRFKRRFSLNNSQLMLFMSTPTADPRWQQGKLAALARLCAAQTVSGDSELLRATGDAAPILALVRDLGRAKVALPSDIAGAVKAAAAARDELAAEMERLRGEVDPQAIQNLDRRVAALDASQRDADLRALLVSQRELMAKLERRLESLGARRLRLDEQLCLLHEQLIELRASDAEKHEDITGRIRLMSEDLRRVGDAWNEAEHIVVG